MTDTVLRIEHLSKTFVRKSLFKKATEVKAVDDVSFDLLEGEVLVIAGESGSGKSTIAKIILGAIKADSGMIKLDNRAISYDKESKNIIQKSCQMIHQDPYDSINPRMRIRDIVAESLHIHRIGDAQSRQGLAAEALRDVKMDPDDIMQKYPHMLSGGQRQRVVLARALAVKPRIIIADEPVSMLDVSIRAEMLELMRDLQQKRDISFIYITHDLATARHFGSRIVILYRGAVVEYGDINQTLDNPQHAYTQSLISAISEPDPSNRLRQRPVMQWDG
ncbi:MAG: ABC transporter ATP-binding protein [Cenarchaeum sp. SB0665_bin_23]|nr:ABC transporter ATP-binding protein [Cenarchaeum sp. SB0667_bin_13]MXY37821.1 ABC transporter ATP-binding protein [Cenarchaeum sp. SB0664_bin_35]MXY60905.1 ABC transporter ATP-binding protein [Cenarchaeum sp. SB0665_bin_23]MXZ93351.1 ABC transporter ATP-binding protein [Cenarchaeum sp. SB0666_bin_15]MYB47608.1 ABC transporter ATP-binding protein [Cenarchaeum sp. SB0662_bin_33]MYC80369.1 ABC transporter ATP-binding protein [Cenarchaeum sp. SB0661_bin_35]MYD58364.1 ABC transporter ATP-bindin